ncbi:ABC transporter permease [Jiangella gansuensis]|uniref:ABC transporter permease n=1 Tax=Jiangella gansuensis TaxID=281473 RepID=UPI00047D6BC3|nr:ABC transporter permease [Jiangella gansuensis]
MTPFILRRAGQAAIVLFGAATIVFFAMRLVPGDPATVLLGPDAGDDAVAQLRERLGLDQPLLVQYGVFLQRALTLDFGESVRLADSAAALVFGHFGATALLAGCALLIALVIGFPLGAWAASRPDGVVDRVVSTVSMTTQSLPTFWVGIMLVLIFSRILHLLPSFGAGSPQAIVMPAVTLALPLVSVIVRLVRTGLLEVLSEDYIVTARAKGLPERQVLRAHAVRNMLIPVSTVVALEFGGLLGGAVIVETVFAWPGIGRLMTDAIAARDYAVVQACVLTVAFVFVTINFLVDLLYGVLDPRIRRAGGTVR